jgi:hypothetical protein
MPPGFTQSVRGVHTYTKENKRTGSYTTYYYTPPGDVDHQKFTSLKEAWAHHDSHDPSGEARRAFDEAKEAAKKAAKEAANKAAKKAKFAMAT